MECVWPLFLGLDLDDWTSIATLIGIGLALNEFRLQRRDRATDEAFSLMERAGGYWEKIHISNQHQKFYVGELLAFYEIVCGAYVEGRIGRSAREVLKGHLDGAFDLFSNTDHLSEIVRDCKNKSNVFEDILRYLKGSGAKSKVVELFDPANVNEQKVDT